MSHFTACKKTSDASSVAQLFFTKIHCYWQICGIYKSFLEGTLEEIWQLPQVQFYSDGFTEAINRTLSNLIKCLSGYRPKQWDLALFQAEFSFNGMVNRSIGKKPFEIIYTKPPNFITYIIILPNFKSTSATKTAL